MNWINKTIFSVCVEVLHNLCLIQDFSFLFYFTTFRVILWYFRHFYNFYSFFFSELSKYKIYAIKEEGKIKRKNYLISNLRNNSNTCVNVFVIIFFLNILIRKILWIDYWIDSIDYFEDDILILKNILQIILFIYCLKLINLFKIVYWSLTFFQNIFLFRKYDCN